MVRRITMDEASANFKDIVERALENGDSLELERDGQIVAKVEPQPPTPKTKISLAQLMEELAAIWPDDEFAKDVEEGMRWSRSQVSEDKWER